MSESPNSYFYTWSAQERAPDYCAVGGHGVFVHTEEGSLLDLGSLNYQAHLGYGHPRLVAALREQLSTLAMAAPNSQFAAKNEAAAAILDLVGEPYARVFFTLGGAEAVENAMKIARLYTGKTGFVSRRRSYHGATLGALSLTGEEHRRLPLGSLLPEVWHAAECYCHRCPFALEPAHCQRECAEDVDQLIAATGERVAAVVVEPVVGANGVFIPPREYWPELREICNRREALLVADEVLTGCGRTGEPTAVSAMEGDPDILVLGKGLTAGYAPLGAVVVTAEIAEYFAAQTLWMGLTYYGYPLGCRAALETLAVYREEGIFARVRHLAPKLANFVEALKKRYPRHIPHVRAIGFLSAVEMALSEEQWQRLASALKKQQVLVHVYPQRGIIVMAPPLIISAAELDEGLQRVERAVASTLGESSPERS